MSDLLDEEHPPPFGPRGRTGRRAPRQDARSAWLGNLIFLLGTLFGMGFMWLLGDLLPADEDPGLAHFRDVRQFLLETHVSDLDEEELV